MVPGYATITAVAVDSVFSNKQVFIFLAEFQIKKYSLFVKLKTFSLTGNSMHLKSECLLKPVKY